MRSVHIEAGRALAAVPAQALMPEQRAARDRALGDYRATQRVNADRPEAWLNLGNLEYETGNPGQAEQDFRTALELDPAWEPAYANLADLPRATGRDGEAEKLQRGGIRRLPKAAGLHHALGLLEVRRKNMKPALASLKRAVELDPRSARYGFVYAVALREMGRSREALAVTEAALAHAPNDRNLEQLHAQLRTTAADSRTAPAGTR